MKVVDCKEKAFCGDFDPHGYARERARVSKRKREREKERDRQWFLGASTESNMQKEGLRGEKYFAGTDKKKLLLSLFGLCRHKK